MVLKEVPVQQTGEDVLPGGGAGHKSLHLKAKMMRGGKWGEERVRYVSYVYGREGVDGVVWCDVVWCDVMWCDVM